MSLASPTAAEWAEWLATATDTTRPLLERQLAASNVVAAADALAAAVRAEEKEQREEESRMPFTVIRGGM